MNYSEEYSTSIAIPKNRSFGSFEPKMEALIKKYLYVLSESDLRYLTKTDILERVPSSEYDDRLLMTVLINKHLHPYISHVKPNF